MEKNSDLEPVFYGNDEKVYQRVKYNYSIKNNSLLTSNHSVALPDKITSGVYRCEALSQLFCSDLLEEIEAARISTHFKLDRTGVDLLSLNFDAVINNILIALLPTIKQIPEFSIGPNCHVSLLSAYVVGYQFPQPSHHPVHADDCDITLNVNLGKTFSGGDLFFLDPDTKQVIGSTKHSVGNVIVHSGDLPHGAKPISSGERYNLIIWLKKKYSFEQFSLLPKELQRYALNSFSIKQLCRLAQTSKEMKSMVYQADSAWAHFAPNDEESDSDAVNRQDIMKRYQRGRLSDKKLILILKELIETERSYFASLKHGLVHGIEPLFKEFGSSGVLKDQSILKDLQEIVTCHEQLLAEIDSCIVDLNTNNELNAINMLNIFEILFQRHSSYYQYIKNQEHFQNLLRQFDSDKHVKKFLQEFTALPESRGQSLEGYLIMPVRRIPRYQLLFKEMQKHVGSLTNGEDVSEMTQKFVGGLEMICKLLNTARMAQEEAAAKDESEDNEKSDEKHKRCTVS